MAGLIKYSTSNPSKSGLRKGNTVIGTGNDNYGPSSVTGYAAGMDIPLGGYVVYTIGLNNNPKMWTANTGNDLIPIARTLGGNPTTVEGAIYYICSVTDAWILDNPINDIVTDGLELYLNSKNLSSYPGINTSFMDISGGGKNGTLVNGPTFNSNGYLDFDGADDYIELGSSNTSLVQGKEEVSMGLLFKLDALGPLRGLIGTLNYSCTRNLGLTANGTSLNFYNDNTSCYSVGVGGVETGKWLYGVGTYDGTTTRTYMFKDGNLSKSSGTGKSGATNTFTSKFRVMGPDHSYRTNGQCVNAFVYNKTLTEAEILQNYFQGPIVTDGLTFAADADNLVSYENGSTTAYSLTGSFSGSLINGVGYNDDRGGAWEFDGTDEGIKFITEFDLSGYSSLTYEGWINGAGVTTLDRWFSGTTGASGFHQPDLAIDSNGRLSYYFGILGTAWQQPSIFISTTEYSHVVFTFTNSGDVEIYVNGSSVYTATHSSGTFQTVSNYMIGNRYDRNGEGFVGDIATVRTYNRALTAEEVMQNYNASVGKYK